MRRTMVASAVVAAALGVLGTPSAALGGGGCHGTTTEADATGEAEATVHMVEACFDPSVLRIDPGAAVTFENQDEGLIHNVGGTEWGFYGDMGKGATFTATFDEPGVYPFACSYHPGMTGAIVVGDAYGAGSGWTVLGGEPTAPAVKSATETTPAADRGSSTLSLLAAGVLGIALGVATIVGIGRLRRPSAA